jgi:hypothetical protein
MDSVVSEMPSIRLAMPLVTAGGFVVFMEIGYPPNLLTNFGPNSLSNFADGGLGKCNP